MPMVHAIVLDAEKELTTGGVLRPKWQGRPRLFHLPPPPPPQLLEGMDAYEFAESGNPDALRYALDQNPPFCWDYVMELAVLSGSLDCVKVLYDKGYEQHRSTEPPFSPYFYIFYNPPVFPFSPYFYIFYNPPRFFLGGAGGRRALFWQEVRWPVRYNTSLYRTMVLTWQDKTTSGAYEARLDLCFLCRLAMSGK
jgi:hypothetical protein